jgi:hypothetical protein
MMRIGPQDTPYVTFPQFLKVHLRRLNLQASCLKVQVKQPKVQPRSLKAQADPHEGSGVAAEGSFTTAEGTFRTPEGSGMTDVPSEGLKISYQEPKVPGSAAMIYSFYQNLSDSALLFFMTGLLVYLSVNGVRLGIVAAAITALENVRDLYREKFLKVAEDNNHGPGDTAAKVEAKRAAIVALEQFVNIHVRPNRAWTKEDLIGAGFPRQETGNTGKIEESPWISLTQTESGVIKAHGQSKSMSGSGMPRFAKTLETAWAYKQADGAFPAAEETTDRVTFFSATGTITVPNAESGRTIIVYGRYHNNSGSGPWGAGTTIVIS